MVQLCLAFRDGDGLYAMHAAATLTSVLQNTQMPLTVCVIHDETLHPERRGCLEAVAAYFGQDIRFHDVQDKLDALADLEIPKLGLGSLYRLFIPECIAAKHAIYIDCDMCFTCDVREILDDALACPHALLACVRDDGARFYPPMRAYVKRVGMDPDKYFNSGLMVMNIPAIRATFDNFADAVLRMIRRLDDSEYKDQDALNLIFKNLCVHYLHERFNCIMHIESRLLWKGKDLQGKVLHYCVAKPWGPFPFPAVDLHRANYRMVEDICARHRSK